MNDLAGVQTPAVPQQTRRNVTRYSLLAFVSGSLALLAGLVMEFVPFYGNGGTIPRANAVCSGFGGLFIQGLARAFGKPGQGARVASACSTATTAEHFIGPLIIGGLLLLAAGIVLTVRERNAAKDLGAEPDDVWNGGENVTVPRRTVPVERRFTDIFGHPVDANGNVIPESPEAAARREARIAGKQP